MTSATGRIRIVRVPAGEAPKEVRQAWVGLVLPCEPIVGFGRGPEYNLLSQTRRVRTYGFRVPQDLAIEALERVTPEAARWWREHGFPHPNMNFVFCENEAVILYGVVYQRLVPILCG